jgi:hypothetical protein
LQVLTSQLFLTIDRRFFFSILFSKVLISGAFKITMLMSLLRY